MKKGPHILIVEDVMVIGLHLKMCLLKRGFAIQGPFRTSAAALDALDSAPIDIGILDVNLHDDDTSLDVAVALARAKTPFLFLTGFTSLPAGFADLLGGDAAGVPILTKPVVIDDLVGHLSRLLAY